MTIKLWDGKSELQHGDWVGFQEFVHGVEDCAVGFFIGEDSAGWSTFEMYSEISNMYDSWLVHQCKVTTVEAVRNAKNVLAQARER